MNRSINVTARFSPVRLYVNPTPDRGSVDVTPSGVACGVGCWSFEYGTQITLTARGCCDWSFDYWSGACSFTRSDRCSFRIYDLAETTPRFECVGDCTGQSVQPISRDVPLKVWVRGSGGIVEVNGTKCYSRASGCPFTFTRAQPITLRASGNRRFKRWEQACTGVLPTCQFSAFKDIYGRPPKVYAIFG
jgi:hypothetical protein